MALKILLADDNITAQKMGSKILTDAGYQVVAVSNGAAAMKKIASEKPELMILDIFMPGYTGLEVCEKVKKAPETAAVPVVLTFTNMEPFNPEDGNRVKADGVMVKPFEASDLIAIVQKFEAKLHPAAPPEEEYNKTVKMAAMEFKDASYEEWKADAPPEDEGAGQRLEVSQEMAVSPALGMEDMMVEAQPAEAQPAPAFSAEPAGFAIEDTQPAEAAPVFSAEPAGFAIEDTQPVEAAPAFSAEPAGFAIEDTQPVEVVPAVEAQPAPGFAAESGEFTIEDTQPVEAPAPLMDLEAAPAAPAFREATPEPVATPAPEVEFTSAPQVGEIEVAPAAELEVTAQASETEVPLARDPALVTDPTDFAQFATKFGDAPGQPSFVPEEPAGEAIAAIPEITEPAERPAAAISFETPVEEAPPVVEPAPVQAESAPPVQAIPLEAESSAASLEEEMRRAFDTGGGAAAAPALAPEPEPVAQPEPVAEPEPVVEAAQFVDAAPEPAPVVEAPAPPAAAIPDKLVEQFAAELAQAEQVTAEVAAAESVAEAAPVPAAAAGALDEQRVGEAVQRVLGRYKDELVAAIVRELKS